MYLSLYHQVSTEVLDMQGGIECVIEPLEDGLNFLSDAFFVKLKNETEEHNLFVKVRL